MFCAGGTCISSPGKAICECGIGRGLDPDGIKCIGECELIQPGHQNMQRCDHWNLDKLDPYCQKISGYSHKSVYSYYS